MSRVDEITREGPSITVVATPNGKARVPIFLFDRATGTQKALDTINPANKRERDRYIGEADEALRPELTWLLLEIAAEIQTRLVARKEETQTTEAPYRVDQAWPQVVDGAALLDSLVEQITRYVVLPAHAVEATALWVLHTYVTDVTDYTPYLLVTSPTRQCGKSTKLDLLQQLAFRAIKSDGYTAAALYRRIDQWSPTMLLDELDTRLRGDGGEALRGVLNSGFQKGGKVTICVGDNHEARDFKTYCPKVLAGIGRPWDTVTSRSIPIRMERAQKAELQGKRKIRGHLIAEECAPYRQQALRWANDQRGELLEADPQVPDELGARQADVWRPLLAIADTAGGEWPARARAAAIALHRVAEQEGDYGLLLLADVRQIVRTAPHSGASAIFTAELLKALCDLGDDRPWGEYTKDRKALSGRAMATLFGRFTVRPRTVRIGEMTSKGYTMADLEPLFARYLPAESTTTESGGNNPSQASHAGPAELFAGVTDVTDSADGMGRYEHDERAAMQEGA